MGDNILYLTAQGSAATLSQAARRKRKSPFGPRQNNEPGRRRHEGKRRGSPRDGGKSEQNRQPWRLVNYDVNRSIGGTCDDLETCSACRHGDRRASGSGGLAGGTANAQWVSTSLTIPQQGGGTLSAVAYAPDVTGGSFPLITMLPGGGAQTGSVEWAATRLAAAGYVVLITKPQFGGSTASYNTAARSGIDFMLSAGNPYLALTDAGRIGAPADRPGRALSEPHAGRGYADRRGRGLGQPGHRRERRPGHAGRPRRAKPRPHAARAGSGPGQRHQPEPEHGGRGQEGRLRLGGGATTCRPWRSSSRTPITSSGAPAALRRGTTTCRTTTRRPGSTAGSRTTCRPRTGCWRRA